MTKRPHDYFAKVSAKLIEDVSLDKHNHRLGYYINQTQQDEEFRDGMGLVINGVMKAAENKDETYSADSQTYAAKALTGLQKAMPESMEKDRFGDIVTDFFETKLASLSPAQVQENRAFVSVARGHLQSRTVKK